MLMCHEKQTKIYCVLRYVRSYKTADIFEIMFLLLLAIMRIKNEAIMRTLVKT